MSFHWILAVALVASPGGSGRKPTSLVGAKAPAIKSRQWINGDSLGFSHLEGRVVLVQFWAFDNERCMWTVPAMRQLRRLLPTSEVVLLSVHTPETDRERERVHLDDAVRNLDIDYPIAIDNDRATWDAFHGRIRPSLYVIDRRGNIRHVLTGELRPRTKRWDALLEVVDRLRQEKIGRAHV